MKNAQEIGDKIATVALEHFHSLPRKAKPQSNEWTVFAAIVATREDNFWVVSSATGTKATASDHDGYALRDCHAEVLARRGLVYVLLDDMAKIQRGNDKDTFLLERSTNDQNYTVKTGIDFHLYISDSPCGDASIYDTGDPNQTSGLQFTGSKAIVENSTNDPNVQVIDASRGLVREQTQQIGCLRTKSGRSNIMQERRSTSMSCSDKIARWNYLGLQGGLLTKWIRTPICFASVIVSRDPRTENEQRQMSALHRAVVSRTPTKGERQAKEVNVIITDKVFEQSKSQNDSTQRKRKREETKVSPSGMAMNWNQAQPEPELVVGARGLKQGGRKKNKDDLTHARSRLSRRSFLDRLSELTDISEKGSYRKLKVFLQSKDYIASRASFFDSSPFQKWLIDTSDFNIDAGESE